MMNNYSKLVRLTQKNRYSFIPPSCYDIQHKINPIINVTLGTQKADYCNIQFRLFQNVVPKTAENFKRLLLGNGKYQNRLLSLVNNKVHNYVPRAYFELGNLTEGNCSIFGPNFRDQSFELLHDRAGLLTSISQENTNNSRFAITLAPCSFMDYKNTIFGQITAESISQLKRIQKLGNRILDLRIKRTQQIPIQIQSHDHAHHH